MQMTYTVVKWYILCTNGMQYMQLCASYSKCAYNVYNYDYGMYTCVLYTHQIREFCKQ